LTAERSRSFGFSTDERSCRSENTVASRGSERAAWKAICPNVTSTASPTSQPAYLIQMGR
jgi:hypothetical protein